MRSLWTRGGRAATTGPPEANPFISDHIISHFTTTDALEGGGGGGGHTGTIADWTTNTVHWTRNARSFSPTSLFFLHIEGLDCFFTANVTQSLWLYNITHSL